MLNATLTVLPPAGASLRNATCDDPGLLAVAGVYAVQAADDAAAAAAGVCVVRLRGVARARGRARVVLHYSDGTSQAVHYYVLPPFRDHVAACVPVQACAALVLHVISAAVVWFFSHFFF